MKTISTLLGINKDMKEKFYNVVFKDGVIDAVREQGLLCLSLYNVFPAFCGRRPPSSPDLKLSDDGSKKVGSPP